MFAKAFWRQFSTAEQNWLLKSQVVPKVVVKILIRQKSASLAMPILLSFPLFPVFRLRSRRPWLSLHTTLLIAILQLANSVAETPSEHETSFEFYIPRGCRTGRGWVPQHLCSGVIKVEKLPERSKSKPSHLFLYSLQEMCHTSAKSTT